MKRFFSILFFIFVLFALTGCGNEVFNEAMKKGKLALADRNYVEASNSFELALEEKDDNEAQILYEQTSIMVKAENFLKEKKFDEVINLLKKVQSMKNGSSMVKKDAKEREQSTIQHKELLVKFEQDLAKTQGYITNRSFPEAEAALATLQQETSTNELLKGESAKVATLAENLKSEKAKVAEEQRIVEENRKAEEQTKAEEAKKVAEAAEAVKPKTITKEQAIQNVKRYAEVPDNPNVFVEYEYQLENGDYVIHVYEVVIDVPATGEGHTATWGWYGVNKDSGIVYDALF
ncbi:hypothetical protein P5G62_005650 [Neobacillus sp. 179-C4.2 HS]|uniref:Lipoprotein n=1 Tax=Neobacillus driksii TaxID=3035913 RepID=A0ABV4YPC9_9BACI|nr:hypothetical protein [Neobacillus sp. 179.-C4.2 HS]MDP5197163.1 hypothetical protein [Neobacillus sp. 179.-C4.2 HS]